jgi:hypothetical protein
MGRVFYTELPAHLKLTLLALADHANDDGEGVRVGQERLAKKVGASVRGVRRHVIELRELGYLEKLERRGSHGVDRHRIAVEKLPTDEQIRLFRPDTRGRPANLADRPSEAPSTGHPASLDRTPVSAKPSVEPSVEPLGGRTKTPRRNDPIWDGFVAWLAREPETETERGAWNKAAKQLRDIGVESSDDVVRRGLLYGRRYPEAARTPNALVAHWSEFGIGNSMVPAARSRRVSELTDEELEAMRA